MDINQVNEHTIKRVNTGDEKAFSLLYKAYYTYLNAIAVYYMFNKDIAREIVNDVFINLWHKREKLTFPVHGYIVRSVQNGCLNYLRMQYSYEKIMDKYKEKMFDFHEEHILSTPDPLQYVEINEMESQIRSAISKLPEKCRIIFEKYYEKGLPPDKIAQTMNLNISTVRVQLKNAADKLKVLLKYLAFF